MNKGAWYAVGAYVTWGLFPLYWKLLKHVSAFQLIGHRIAWSCALLLVAVTASRQLKDFGKSFRQPKVLRIYSLAGALIAVNWLVYIWAVNSGFIVETSLGYFINPLVSVVFGVWILGERLRVGQWLAVGLAGIGVLYLAYTYGAPPWISLTLACTFGLYGLVKKTAPLGSVHGLALETLLLLPIALAYLVYEDISGRASFLHGSLTSDALMVGGGAVTVVPLLLFVAAARRMPLSIGGLFQYIAPTLQFLIGVLVFHEPFSHDQAVGFSVVWIALALLAVESAWSHRRQARRRAVV